MEFLEFAVIFIMLVGIVALLYHASGFVTHHRPKESHGPEKD